MAVATAQALAVPCRHSKSAPFSLRTRFKTFTNTAEVLIGPSKTRFLVHRELLTFHSPFFAAALNGTFAEGLSQSVTLPEERVDTFELFVFWLYTQNLDEVFIKDGKPTYFLLLDLYSTADRLSVEKLRNQVVDKVAELAEEKNSVPTPSDTYILYESIRDNAPMRQLILDLFAFKKTDNLLENHPHDWHPRFLRDLIVKLKRKDLSAMWRHDIAPWKPSSWTTTKACDNCAVVLKPELSANLCKCCKKAFCRACMGNGRAGYSAEWAADSACKPWKRDMCRYHEHVETLPCREETTAVRYRRST
ncbi:hypothetical protein H2201_007217 [Coniosporium apollinis]|uniref:BTB domain-containing protein n=1 Tax=Coniosporium apollinis TaxID=61459 RepID=A0ABQ9NJZ1_9PEZI|nr:hypothetical protein H2201_007217 [Coniosporium apollinis]